MVETVVHRAGEFEHPGHALQLGKQHCQDCGLLLWHHPAPSTAHGENWPDPAVAGELIGVRIDKTFRDGYVIGYFWLRGRELEDDERRCTESA